MSNEMDNAAIAKLLRRKIAAGEIDTDIAVTLAEFEIVALMKQVVNRLSAIENRLTGIDAAIAPNREGVSLYRALEHIAVRLEKIFDQIKR